MDNRHLIASEGMMLTNGETYGVEVWLGSSDSSDNWWEIPREEYESIQEAFLSQHIESLDWNT